MIKVVVKLTRAGAAWGKAVKLFGGFVGIVVVVRVKKKMDDVEDI